VANVPYILLDTRRPVTAEGDTVGELIAARTKTLGALWLEILRFRQIWAIFVQAGLSGECEFEGALCASDIDGSQTRFAKYMRDRGGTATLTRPVKLMLCATASSCPGRSVRCKNRILGVSHCVQCCDACEWCCRRPGMGHPSVLSRCADLPCDPCGRS